MLLKKIKRALFVWVLLFFSLQLLSATSTPTNRKDDENMGLQKITLKNNETQTVSLSKDDANRLIVNHDEIQNAWCSSGFCQVRYTDTGTAYIIIGGQGMASTGFSLFIDTKAKRHVNLIVHPVSTIGQTIDLSIIGSGSPANTLKAMNGFKKNPYQSFLAKYMKAMILYFESINHLSTSSDFFTSDKKAQAMIESLGLSAMVLPNEDGVNGKSKKSKKSKNSNKSIGKKDDTKNAHALLIKPSMIFKGNGLTGIVVMIKNLSNQPQGLSASSFYQKGMLIGALSTDQLSSQGIGYFYGLSFDGSDDEAFSVLND